MEHIKIIKQIVEEMQECYEYDLELKINDKASLEEIAEYKGKIKACKSIIRKIDFYIDEQESK